MASRQPQRSPSRKERLLETSLQRQRVAPDRSSSCQASPGHFILLAAADCRLLIIVVSNNAGVLDANSLATQREM
jgi:hypothetical protein